MYLEKRLARLEAKLEKLLARAEASEDVEEVKELTSEIEEVKEEISDVKEELEEAKEEAEEEKEEEKRSMAEVVNARTVFEQTEDKDMAYRKAFMEYVQRGKAIPSELRATTSTADTGEAIPTTVMNEVVNTIKDQYGTLYAKVRKLNVPGGVKIPVGSLSASFKWISEDTVSPRQKLEVGAVTFGYNTAEIRISQTFLSSILTVSAFEAEITKVIAQAYLKAMDDGIVNGSGDGAMTGILNDSSVTTSVTMTATKMANWTNWKKDVLSAIPMGYKGGEFIFNDATVISYLETMADSNNHPIYKEVGVDGVNDRFMGKPVTRVSSDILPSFDEASSSDVIGIYWIPSDYGINENFGFTMRRYFDEETNEYVDKAICVVDGKVINPTGFIKIVKG